METGLIFLSSKTYGQIVVFVLKAIKTNHKTDLFPKGSTCRKVTKIPLDSHAVFCNSIIFFIPCELAENDNDFYPKN